MRAHACGTATTHNVGPCHAPTLRMQACSIHRMLVRSVGGACLCWQVQQCGQNEPEGRAPGVPRDPVSTPIIDTPANINAQHPATSCNCVSYTQGSQQRCPIPILGHMAPTVTNCNTSLSKQQTGAAGIWSRILIKQCHALVLNQCNPNAQTHIQHSPAIDEVG